MDFVNVCGNVRILGGSGTPFAKMLGRWLKGHGFRLDEFNADTHGIAVCPPGLIRNDDNAGADSVLVFRADDAASASFAARHAGLLLDYGRTHTDTLTISSLTETCAVLALQRPVSTLGGEILEPMEFSVELSGSVPEDILFSAAAVCLLCGRFEAICHFP